MPIQNNSPPTGTTASSFHMELLLQSIDTPFGGQPPPLEPSPPFWGALLGPGGDGLPLPDAHLWKRKNGQPGEFMLFAKVFFPPPAFNATPSPFWSQVWLPRVRFLL